MNLFHSVRNDFCFLLHYARSRNDVTLFAIAVTLFRSQ